ncbi:MAG: hypothetical protein HQK54_11675 [Oligoflexales bacterium]|nr:hypothetical protein [Oligoflexales bacterium]
MQKNINIIDDIVVNSVERLFNFLGFTVPFKASKDDNLEPYLNYDTFGLVITMGQLMNGAWGISVSSDLLRTSHKLATNRELIDEKDWLTELTNQVVGIIKTRLVEYNMDFEVSTVLIVNREHLLDSFWPIAPIRHQHFENHNGFLDIFYGVYFSFSVDLDSMTPDKEKVIGTLGSGIVF